MAVFDFEKKKGGDYFAYKIKELIASGGDCNVYEVENDGRKYAMRVRKEDDEAWKNIQSEDCTLPAQGLVSDHDIQSFKAEVEIWRTLTKNVSGCVIALIDSGFVPVRWEVMNYAPEDFFEYIRSGEATLWDYLDLLEELEEIHSLGIVHLDIKPENIRKYMGKWRFSDFDSAGYDGRCCQTKGTRRSMAPEQFIEGSNTDRRTDIFQIGCLAYSIIVGDPERTPVTDIDFVKNVPEDYQDVIKKSVESDPRNRYRKVSDFLDDLKQIIDNRSRGVVTKKDTSVSNPLDDQNEIWFQTGEKYYFGDGVRESAEEAVKWYRKAAEQNHDKSQCALGYCYKFGQGVEQSYEEAYKWFSKAADLGNAESCGELGFLFINGLGVQQSYELAVEWFLKGANLGDSFSQGQLGRCYEKGLGVKQSIADAVFWYKQAAEKGDRNSQYYLGNCYYNGNGVELSYKEAFSWFKAAADQGDEDAMYKVGLCYFQGRGTDQSYKEARSYFWYAANRGNIEAQYLTAVCLEYGYGTASVLSEAFKWYQTAAEQNYPLAQFKVGEFYKNGWTVRQSDSTAVEWFLKSAEQGCPEAQYLLGLCYLSGEGLDKSYQYAIDWLTKAADQNYSMAIEKLGECYENGWGVPQSKSKADMFYSKAISLNKKDAEDGDLSSQISVAKAYYYGRGVDLSYPESYKWFKLAASQQSNEALLWLGSFYEHGYGVVQSMKIAADYYSKALKEKDRGLYSTLSEISDFQPVGDSQGVNIFYRLDKTNGHLDLIGNGDIVGGSPLECNAWKSIEIRSVRIWEGIESIGNEIFSKYEALVSVDFPKSLHKIGNYVFAQCNSLKTFKVPDTVSTIGQGLFKECESLTNIDIPNTVTSIEHGAFNYCTNLKTVVLPNHLEYIDENLFYGCESLQSIQIPPNVKSIGDSAFRSCRSLTSISIPHGVSIIAKNAFNFCSSLTTVYLPSTLISLSSDAFSFCKNLSQIYVESGIQSDIVQKLKHEYPYARVIVFNGQIANNSYNQNQTNSTYVKDATTSKITEKPKKKLFHWR